MLVLECAPAAYINIACNEAEKTASIKLIHVSSVGRFGRMWLSGTEAEIMTAKNAAIQALESLEGRARRVSCRSGKEQAMPKEFYTERDIEDMFKRGILSLQVNDNVVLTELAYEKANRLGMQLLQASSPVEPPAPRCGPTSPRPASPTAAGCTGCACAKRT